MELRLIQPIKDRQRLLENGQIMRCLTAAALVSLIAATQAFAQTAVRVVADQATIWRPGFTSIATVVNSGTLLEVVAERGDWYVVVLPAGGVPANATGLISAKQVEPVAGVRPDRGAAPSNAQPGTAGVGAGRGQSASGGLRGFGNVGYGWFEARRGFQAVFDHAGGFWFGGGGEYRFPAGYFVQGSVERFTVDGERVAVFNNEVFKVGIPDTVKMTPVTITAGYRFDRDGRTVPYIGGGAGRYFFSERSTFANSADDVSTQFTSYHVVGGLEWRADDWLATAVEVQYTHVPTSLTTGALNAFGERSLGGVQLRLKVLVGK
jgi:opacity protein-like surface antigen